MEMDPPSFACGMCGKCFSDAEQCRLHIQTHTGQQPFRCIICWPLFYDMPGKEALQPCVSSQLVTPAVTSMSSKDTSASQATVKPNKDVLPVRMASSATASTVGMFEPPGTPSECSLDDDPPELELQGVAPASVDPGKLSMEESQIKNIVATSKNVVGKSEMDSLMTSSDEQLLMTDNVSPDLESENDTGVSVNSEDEEASELKIRADMMVNMRENTVDESMSESVISSDKEISMDLSPEEGSMNTVKRESENILETVQAYTELDPFASVRKENTDADEVQKVDRVGTIQKIVKDEVDPLATIQGRDTVANKPKEMYPADTCHKQHSEMDHICTTQERVMVSDKEKCHLGAVHKKDTVPTGNRSNASDLVQKKDTVGNENKEKDLVASVQKENTAVLSQKKAVFIAAGKDTLLNVVKNDTGAETSQNIPLLDEDQDDTIAKESEMAAAQNLTPVHEAQRDAYTTTSSDSTSTVDVMAYNETVCSSRRESRQRVSIVHNSTTRDSVVNHKQNLRSENYASDKTKNVVVSNGNHAEVPGNTDVSRTSLLSLSGIESVPVSVIVDLSSIQHPFEEVVSVANCTKEQMTSNDKKVLMDMPQEKMSVSSVQKEPSEISLKTAPANTELDPDASVQKEDRVASEGKEADPVGAVWKDGVANKEMDSHGTVKNRVKKVIIFANTSEETVAASTDSAKQQLISNDKKTLMVVSPGETSVSTIEKEPTEKSLKTVPADTGIGPVVTVQKEDRMANKVKEAGSSGIAQKDVTANKEVDLYVPVKKKYSITKIVIVSGKCKEAFPLDANQKEGTAREGVMIVTTDKETLSNPVQNMTSLETPQNVTITTMPDESLGDTIAKESVMAAVQNETQKEAYTTAKSPRCSHSTATDAMAQKTMITNRRGSCQKASIFHNSTTCVCDSCVNQEKYLMSGKIVSDMTQNVDVSNGNQTEMQPWSTSVSGCKSSFSTSINVPLSMDLSRIQYSFEELVASADFADYQQMTKELKGSTAFSVHHKSPQNVEFHRGRRKKGKPQKLSVEGPLSPFVAERLRQEAAIQGYHICGNQFKNYKNDKSDSIDPRTSAHRLTYISLHSEADDCESESRHQGDDSRHQDQSPKDSAISFEVKRPPVSHMAFQEENVTCEFQMQTTPQELMQKEESLDKGADVLDEGKVMGTVVNFQGLISFLKNVQLKGSSDFKTSEGNNNERSDNESGTVEQVIFETAREPMPSPDLNISPPSGNKEQIRVLDSRDDRRSKFFEGISREGKMANRTTVSTSKSAHGEDLYESSKERTSTKSTEETETSQFLSQECTTNVPPTTSKADRHLKIVKPKGSNAESETLIHSGDPQKGRHESDVSDASKSDVSVSSTTCKESDSASVKVRPESVQTEASSIRAAVRCEPDFDLEDVTLPDLTSDISSMSQKVSDTNCALNTAHKSAAALAVSSVNGTLSTADTSSEITLPPIHTALVSSGTAFSNKVSHSKFPSVCLSRIPDNILQDLLAGKTMKVSFNESLPRSSFRISSQLDNLFKFPAHCVTLQNSEAVHEDEVQNEEVSDSDRTVLFGDEESLSDMCWSPSKSDSSGESPRMSMQQALLSEDTNLESSRQQDMEQGLPEKGSSPNPKMSNQREMTEVEETVHEKTQQSSQSVEYTENQVNQNLSETEEDATKVSSQIKEVDTRKQCANKEDAQDTRDVTDRFKLTEHGKQLNAEDRCVHQGKLSASSCEVLQLNAEDKCEQQGKLSVTSSSPAGLQRCFRKRMLKTSEKQQVKRSRVSAEKQMRSPKETDSYLQNVRTVECKPRNTSHDSCDKVPSVSPNINTDHSVIDTGSSRQENSLHLAMDNNHSVLTTVRGIDEMRLKATDLPVLGSTQQEYLVGEASMTKCKNDLIQVTGVQKSSTLVRRFSEDSLENVDLPQIVKPRRTRHRGGSREYYWRSRHAKTCAIVTKSRLEEHTHTPSDVSARPVERTEISPVSLDCKVVLEPRLNLVQPELSAQQDVLCSSLHETASFEHDQDVVQKETPTNDRKLPDELVQEKEISKNVIMESGSVDSETSEQLASAEIFTPSVAESVKRVASKRKIALQPRTYSEKVKAKTSETVSGDILSEIPDATNGQIQKEEKDLGIRKVTRRRASMKKKACHCSESEHVQEVEKGNPKRGEKKRETHFSQSVYVRPSDVTLGKILCYPCKHCGAKFKKYVNYVRHIRNGCKQRFVCDICGSSLGRRESLKTHMMIHTGEAAVSCQICGRKLCGRQSLVTHMRIHTNERPYECPDCSRTFRQSSGLTSHYRTHTKDRPFKCDICGKSYRFSKNLYSHRLTHTGERPYVCHVCNVSYYQVGNLNVHLKAHSGERPFPCDFCVMRFKQKVQLMKHVRHVHSHKLREMEYKKAKEKAKPHLCSRCNRGFNSVFSMRRHMKSFCFMLNKEGEEAG